MILGKSSRKASCQSFLQEYHQVSSTPPPPERGFRGFSRPWARSWEGLDPGAGGGWVGDHGRSVWWWWPRSRLWPPPSTRSTPLWRSSCPCWYHSIGRFSSHTASVKTPSSLLSSRSSTPSFPVPCQECNCDEELQAFQNIQRSLWFYSDKTKTL